MLSLASRSSHCRLPTPTATRKAPSSRVQVKAMGGIFGGLFGGASRAGQGCELAPKEAPPGLKLATFAGRNGMHAGMRGIRGCMIGLPWNPVVL